MSSTLPSNISNFETAKKPPPKAPRPALGGLVVTIVLAVALIAIIVFAVTRLTSGPLTSPTAARAPTQTSGQAQPTAPPGNPADPATQQAIEQVIQQVDQAQVQAIEGGDPNVMSPTATPNFYQEQVATNQDLVNNGVTDIKLVNIEWGDITVSGNTATATDYETWSTTFDDGTTQQSRDRNVYTLVMDNGTWKVQEDLHPDQPTPSPAQQPGPGGAP